MFHYTQACVRRDTVRVKCLTWEQNTNTLITCCCWSNLELRVASNPIIWDYFVFVLFHSVSYRENLPHTLNQSDAKLKPWLAFSCFPQGFKHCYFEFSLALKGVFLCSNWLLSVITLVFGNCDIQSKRAVHEQCKALLTIIVTNTSQAWNWTITLQDWWPVGVFYHIIILYLVVKILP